MSTLSELLPAGGGGSTVDFVASGTLPNGKPVILKTNGQVEVVVQTTLSESIPSAAEVTFNSTGETGYIRAKFDPSNSGKFVVAYRDENNSGRGTLCVGSVTGTSISFGTEVIFNSGSTFYIDLAFDPSTSNNFVITYVDNSAGNLGTAVVCVLSGTTASVGSEVVFHNDGTGPTSVSFVPSTANKFVVAYKDTGGGNAGRVVTGTVSGTSSSFTSEATFYSGLVYNPKISFDPSTADSFVISFGKDSGTLMSAIVGDSSGASCTFGSVLVINSGNYSGGEPDLAFNPTIANQCVIVYAPGPQGEVGTVVLGTVSGTSISVGSPVVFNNAISLWFGIDIDPSTGKVAISYRDSGASNRGKVIIGTINGASLSFGTEFEFESETVQYTDLSFDPANAGKFVIVYADGSSQLGTARLGQVASTPTNLTSTNFVGTSTKAYTNGQTATIAVQGGLSTNQTGLTIGSTYYVQPAGTLATTAGTPSVNAGKALSATTLLLKDL
jgi:hypothetical protein